MKQIFLTLIFTFCATFSFAQELKVKSFTHDAMNLEARLDGGRTDLNGRQCALVKVMVLDDIVDCEGGNVGNIITKGTVKKIFVSPSARYIKLEFQYHYPLKITFEDYGYKTLTESATYEVSIADANAVVPSSNQQQAISVAQHTHHQQVTVPQQSPSQQSNVNGNILPITVNGVTFNMIKVEGGTFTMGATKEQGTWSTDNDEYPTHKVKLETFMIGETEVTQALWKAVMGSNPSHFQSANKPVEKVSWNDCQLFIKKLNILTGKRFRLPTEAEWEYAARGGKLSRGYRYPGSEKPKETCWYSTHETKEVAKKCPNEIGIYDMGGNVWEWCNDWKGKYSSSDEINPIGPRTGEKKVLRGGSFHSTKDLMRITHRSSNTPDYSKSYIGMRLAL
ncbi:MAG: formylglycine-generating enzyme family protein [Bacteroidales bacterium]|nr:formylglycine-generating enzyme family protein [Bacteroidales bacterium]